MILWRAWGKKSEEKRKPFEAISEEYAQCTGAKYAKKHERPFDFYLMINRLAEREKAPRSERRRI